MPAGRVVKVRRRTTPAEAVNKIYEVADETAKKQKTAATATETDERDGLYYYKRLANSVRELGTCLPEDLDEILEELRDASEAIAGGKQTIDSLNED